MMRLLRIVAFGLIYFSILPIFAQVEDDPDSEEEYDEQYVEEDYDEPSIYDKKGFFIGLNLGYQFTNSDPASFYNGTPPNDMSIYLNSSIIRNQINEELGLTGTDFTFEEAANDMRYKPSFVLGLNMRYHFSRSSAINTDLNYSTLMATDVFVLGLGPSTNGQTQNILQSFDIWGKEQRLSISLGYQQGSYKPAAISGYWELGGVFTTVKIEENKFRIGDLEYNILRAQLLPGNQYIHNAQPNVTSFGTYGQLGLLFSFDQVFMDMGYRLSWEEFEFEDDPKRKFNHLILFRFIYNWGKSDLTEDL